MTTTLAEATKIKIQEGKDNFHYYVKELGLIKAKEMMGNGIIKELKNYINNYQIS